MPRGEGEPAGRRRIVNLICNTTLPLPHASLRALSVPSDRNHGRAGRARDYYLGGSGSGEAVKAPRRSDGIHQGTNSRLGRSTSPDPRGPWTHHS